MKNRSIYQWLGLATLFATLPFLLDTLPSILGDGGVLFSSVKSFFAAFILFGLASGAIFRNLSLVAAPIALMFSLTLLTKAHFIGSGGDGDMFYVLAVFGSGAYCLAALIAGTLLPHILQYLKEKP